MRKLALVAAAFGMLAFVGTARADRKTENTEKTDSSTTITGKAKTTKNHKIERADGSTMEQKVETTRPKPGERQAVDRPPDHKDQDQVKREEKTTLSGKKEMKTTRKTVAPDGTETESTTTTTGPDRDHDNK
jgi:hypothetical protein